MDGQVGSRECCPTEPGSYLCTRLSAAFLVLLSAGSWLCMMWSIIPAPAALHAGMGLKFYLGMRIAIAASNFLWGLPVITVLCLVLWAGFFLKNKRSSAVILLAAAVVGTTVVETLILLGIHDILHHMAAR